MWRRIGLYFAHVAAGFSLAALAEITVGIQSEFACKLFGVFLIAAVLVTFGGDGAGLGFGVGDGGVSDFGWSDGGAFSAANTFGGFGVLALG